MPAKLKAEWLKALRGGNYKQAQSELKNENNGYCCLGVLEMCGLGEVEPDAHYSGRSLTTPSSDALYSMGISPSEFPLTTLIHMNDTLANTFSEIADYVETNIAGVEE